MKRRRELDYKRFNKLSENQSKLIQIINGMQEIKLNNYEKEKRWEWERVQAGLFKVSVKSLSLEQYQDAGSVFINETKNILIIIISATAVIDGGLTLGMMLAIQYIIGQLNTPLKQLIRFMHQAQDAKISLERLAEVHEKKNEEEETASYVKKLPENKSISISNLIFQYEGPRSPKVLNNINLDIPENKTTAIVGVSGSGKTTLIKLLLGFYPPVDGDIKVGGMRLANFSPKMWRENCGVVMQDGFIFSDSVAQNIVVDENVIDEERLYNAVKMANIQDDIESMPLSYNTKIGQEGVGLSQGQKQRILIARAIYKNPSYLFLDEATNALDANNERLIMENMEQFSKGKTVVVVAHRLSTVKNADQIVVLEKGEIVELGKHEELINKKGKYYQLVKNQLELGN
jgi:ATP-binding cassette subfamily B protein